MIISTRSLIIAAFAALALVLAGCSNQGETPAAANGASPPGASLAREIAACPLLTQEDIATVTGATMFPGEERPPMGGGAGSGRMTTCSWTEDIDGPAPTIVTLLVWSWPPGSGGAASYLASFREASRQVADMPEPEPVALGEEALWDSMALHVRTGDVSVSISVSKPNADATTARAAAEALAHTVLGRLG